jgi:tetratricopeptide (TPR) repeat protein
VLFGLGRVALDAREYAAAVKHLEGALSLAPAATRVHYPLAMAYRGARRREAGRGAPALRGETALPPADPLMGEVRALLTNAAALETRGVQAMDARDWPGGGRALREAVALSPDNAGTRLNLGTSLYCSGDRDGALEQYRAAVRCRRRSRAPTSASASCSNRGVRIARRSRRSAPRSAAIPLRRSALQPGRSAAPQRPRRGVARALRRRAPAQSERVAGELRLRDGDSYG